MNRYIVLSFCLIALLFCGCHADNIENLDTFLNLYEGVSISQMAGDDPDSQFLLYSVMYIKDMSDQFALADDYLGKKNWRNLETVGRDITEITRIYSNQMKDLNVSEDLLNFKNEVASGEVYMNQYGTQLESFADDVSENGFRYTSMLSIQAGKVDECREEGQNHLQLALDELNYLDIDPYLNLWTKNIS